MAPDKLIAALGLEHSGAPPASGATPAGILTNAQGERVSSLPGPLLTALRFVLEKQRAGSWRITHKSVGRACGKQLGTGLDGALSGLKQPALAALPLETSIDFLARSFALHAWGLLTLDITAADSRGVIVARLENSWFVATLTDANEYADPFLTGVLEGYFEHLTGQPLTGAELACKRRGAPHCTFVLTAQERLTPVLPLIGRETADVIIARLKG